MVLDRGITITLINIFFTELVIYYDSSIHWEILHNIIFFWHKTTLLSLALRSSGFWRCDVSLFVWWSNIDMSVKQHSDFNVGYGKRTLYVHTCMHIFLDYYLWTVAIRNCVRDTDMKPLSVQNSFCFMLFFGRGKGFFL